MRLALGLALILIACDSDDSPEPTPTQCDILTTFCTDRCQNPADLHDDCLKTASSGNGPRCSTWENTNVSLCKP